MQRCHPFPSQCLGDGHCQSAKPGSIATTTTTHAVPPTTIRPFIWLTKPSGDIVFPRNRSRGALSQRPCTVDIITFFYATIMSYGGALQGALCIAKKELGR